MGFRYNAIDEQYEEVTVLEKQMLFTDSRIDCNTVPKGLYMYEIRHDDDCQGDPVQIAKGVLVNFFGTLITNEPIKLSADGYLDINPEKDWSYDSGDCHTIKEYEDKYPPHKVKQKDLER